MLHFWPLILSALLGIWILRTAIVVALAHQHNQAERTKEANWAEQQSNPCKPLVSILIPACNEEATITDCIQSCIQSNYGNKEIIVVNDGSNDATSDQAHIAEANHPKARITVIDFACNQGKTAALNAGLLYANGEFIVTLDADTRLSDPSSLTRLLDPMIQYENIAACTGNLKIANPEKTIPNIQSIEYIKIIQTFKRAQSHVNAIMILPGAVSAFRATELRSIGGFSTSTLAEDADANMSLLQRRNRLLFTSSASAITPRPEYGSRAAQATHPLACWATAMPLETPKTLQPVPEYGLFLYRHGKHEFNFSCSTFRPCHHRRLRDPERPVATTNRDTCRLRRH